MLKNKRSAIWKIPRDEFIKIYYKKNNLSEILNHFGLKMHGGNNKTLLSRIEYEGLDISIIEEKRKKQIQVAFDKGRLHSKKPLHEILVENSTYTNSYNLKNRLFAEGYLKEKCSKCGLGSVWENKHLSLELDHKNGKKNDNRLENLRLLCPNCHSQTPTFRGKSKKIYYNCFTCGKSITRQSKHKLCNGCFNRTNAKVINRPNRTELINLILNKTFTQIGNEFGVSDNAIRKWCKSEKLPYKKNDIKKMKSELKKEILSS